MRFPVHLGSDDAAAAAGAMASGVSSLPLYVCGAQAEDDDDACGRGGGGCFV